MPTTRYLSIQKAHPSYQQQASDTNGQPTGKETTMWTEGSSVRGSLVKKIWHTRFQARDHVSEHSPALIIDIKHATNMKTKPVMRTLVGELTVEPRHNLKAPVPRSGRDDPEIEEPPRLLARANKGKRAIPQSALKAQHFVVHEEGDLNHIVKFVSASSITSTPKGGKDNTPNG